MVEVAGVETRFYGYVNIWKLSNCITPSDSKLLAFCRLWQELAPRGMNVGRNLTGIFRGYSWSKSQGLGGYSEGEAVEYGEYLGMPDCRSINLR